MSAPDWISPADRLPPEGQPIEISILRNSLDICTGRRLGDAWWIDRQIGEPYRMFEPAAPAFWRPGPGKQTARRAS